MVELKEKVIMDIVDRILAEMQKKGINKFQLSKLSGVKRSTIYNVFNKSYDIKLEALRPIAKVLGVSLDYLVYGEEKPPVEHLSVNHIAKKFNEWGLSVDKLNSLTKEQQVIILNVVKNLVNEFADCNEENE